MMPDNPLEWLHRAASDLAIARSIIEEAYLEDLCYHSQQCVEKAFKAVLLLKKGAFPYTHDLAALASLLQEAGVPLPPTFTKAVRLTRYAVSSRYPGVEEPVTTEQWQLSVDIAESILCWARDIVQP